MGQYLKRWFQIRVERIRKKRNPFFEVHVLFNLLLLIPAIMISAFTLIMGFAHAYEGIANFSFQAGKFDGESVIGWMVVTFLCFVGIVVLVITGALLIAINKQIAKMSGR